MKKLIYIGIISLLVNSCADFLKPSSPTEYIPESAEAIQEMLLGNAYPNCGSYKAGDMQNYFINTIAALDPDITCSEYNFAALDGSLIQNTERIMDMVFSYSPEIPEALKPLGKENEYLAWHSSYEKILGCNAALDYIDGVYGDKEQKDFIKAQAHALRAFYYLYIVNIFSPAYNNEPDGLGAVLKLESAMVDFSRTRSTVKETYDQIIKDLHKAEEYYLLLPKEKQFRPDYMTSLPMVQMLLSRTYLYMSKWDEAANYASKVINEWSFQLIDLNTISEPNDAIAAGNFQYHNFNTYTTSTEGIWFYGHLGIYVDLIKNNELGTATSGDNFKRYFFRASDELLDLYVDGDLRKDRYIIKEQYRAVKTDPYIYTAMAKVPVDNTRKIGPSNIAQYACAIRLSEAYLNLAEALTMSGKNISEVYTTINTLRAKRFSADKYADMPALTGDELINYVRNERRLELCLEAGHRWCDVRRWGIGFEKIYWRKGYTQKLTYEPNDLCLTMPLPYKAYDQNIAIKPNPKGEVKLNINY